MLRTPGWLLLAPALLGSTCQGDEEPSWVQFNGSDDQVTIQVGAAEELDPVSTELHSSVTGIVVGSATVTPGGGPIGTQHSILLVVDDEWENEVGRATVRTDSGDRGKDEYDLLSDPADEGYYGLELISQGSEGEVRSDTLTFRLWCDANDAESSGDDTAG